MIREEHQPTAAMVGGKMEVILGDDRRVSFALMLMLVLLPGALMC